MKILIIIISFIFPILPWFGNATLNDKLFGSGLLLLIPLCICIALYLTKDLLNK